MNKWSLLGCAILSEVAASLSLKAALENPLWYALVVAGYSASFVFLSAVLRAGMPLGIAYGIWGALGVALTAGAASVAFSEPLTPTMLAGMVLVIAGVLCVETGSRNASAPKEPAR
ncbi:QacE family quaternary ammonium compound efflux SMR transporter [Pseudarthrobacter phenanthrenivorans]|uniref:QacE family quaternary ammonium compound efflux SMR transporter n=1 Tax=Pseudarthrobacter phenanthrenivorans TaxID=361575 RepID=A0A3B0FJC2_PSEPS|nr:multidrug efflux SMR transporter [Pseudarthrobacter phenanthrenivorans]RKO19955.1 QacE family quaternary ammonium compound efflux SMR transporter [Pseudarthrobacter phenanthrenivorans]